MEEKQSSLREAFVDVLKKFDIHLEEGDEENADYGEVMEKTQDKLDELRDKMDVLMEEKGLTREQLEKFASDPSHFSKEQWEALERLKKETEDFKQHVAEKLKQYTPKTKKKGKVPRKKDWIPL